MDLVPNILRSSSPIQNILLFCKSHSVFLIFNVFTRIESPSIYTFYHVNTLDQILADVGVGGAMMWRAEALALDIKISHSGLRGT